MTNTVLRADQVSVELNGQPLIAPFSAEIRRAERVALTGMSGSGKTTLLGILSGMYPADSGTVWLFDQPVSPLTQQTIRQKIAYLPQQIPPLDMQVDTYLERLRSFKLNQAATTTPPDICQPQALLAALGLEPETLQQRMADISGGQRQRIGLAGCLQLNRPFLFADEPTSALDADSKQRVFALLEQLGCTLLSVSHDPDMVAFCNQHWHIENQQLQVLAHG